MPESDTVQPAVIVLNTDNDGEYLCTVPNVPQGNYRIQLQCTGGPNGFFSAVSNIYPNLYIIPATGVLQVNISPQQAVNAGAMWRVDGGEWQNSAAVIAGLSNGPHTVEFKDIADWAEPLTTNVEIQTSTPVILDSTYTLLSGSIQCGISPQAAIDGGAQWRITGGVWRNSGYIEPNLPIGSYTVEFKTIADFNTPENQNVQVLANQTVAATGIYSHQSGSVQVNIGPAGAAEAGAKWQIDGGSWQNSTAILSGLAYGEHVISYNDANGWMGPDDEQVFVYSNQTTVVNPQFSPPAAISISILPSQAAAAGAQWRIDSGDWQNSDTTVNNLFPGSYTISYKAIAGWKEPNSQIIQTTSGQTSSLQANYEPLFGALQINISPQAAIDGGAQWRIAGGQWRNSGDVEPNLMVGSYNLEFMDLVDWYEPNTTTAQVDAGITKIFDAQYIIKPCSVTVNIAPWSVGSEGAAWQIDSGQWHSGGYTQTNVQPGEHIISFFDVFGWTEPNAITINLSPDESKTINVFYTPLPGGIQVNISPAQAASAGAGWRINGGPWLASGHTEPNLPAGEYTIDFNDLAGWNKPSPQIVTVNRGLTTNVNADYVVKPGSIKLTIQPEDAINDGAKWRINGGGWLDSGTEVNDLQPGDYIIDFNDVFGWEKPAAINVNLLPDEHENLNASYTAIPGAIKVNIAPQSAVEAGAKWQIDGGVWLDSGYTEANLPAGQYAIGFMILAGHKEPQPRIVNVYRGLTTTVDANYIVNPGAIKINISPQDAINDGAKWRINGGDWLDSGTEVNDLQPGDYIIDFNDVFGWEEPNAMSINITPGLREEHGVSYAALPGTLQVNIAPADAVSAGAVWRINGGQWLASGYKETNLAACDYIVEFNDISGWDRPDTFTATVLRDSDAIFDRQYVRHRGSVQITIDPNEAIVAGAKWRISGGSWFDSGHIEPNIPTGEYIVEFNSIPDWDAPENLNITVQKNTLITAHADYARHTGSITVNIAPSQAVSLGAGWSPDGVIWLASGHTEPNLPTGQYTIKFSPLTGWTKPQDYIVNLMKNQDFQLDVNYVKLPVVPDVVGLDEQNADVLIQNEHLQTGVIIEQYQPDANHGKIISQWPAAGTIADFNDTVDYTIALISLLYDDFNAGLNNAKWHSYTHDANEPAASDAAAQFITQNNCADCNASSAELIMTCPAAKGIFADMQINAAQLFPGEPNYAQFDMTVEFSDRKSLDAVWRITPIDCSALIIKAVDEPYIFAAGPNTPASTGQWYNLGIKITDNKVIFYKDHAAFWEYAPPTGQYKFLQGGFTAESRNAFAVCLLDNVRIAPGLPYNANLNIDDFDPQVNMPDLLVFAANWLNPDSRSQNCFADGADFDISGLVDMRDYVVFAQYWLSGSPEQTIVPDVTDMLLADANDMIVDANLLTGSIAYEYHNTIQSGRVISQSPAAGQSVLLDTPVDLLVSIGLPVVPDIVGLTQTDANAIIAAAPFVCGTIYYDYSMTVSNGCVISQSPAGGEYAAIGSAIDFTVSLGIPQRLIPDICGQTLTEASTVLTNAELTLGAVSYSYDISVPVDRIISQTPPAGSYVNIYSPVDVVVSLGYPPVFVDDNAANDPGPGNPNISDPLEDGSSEHPFDMISEAINAVVAGKQIIVRSGIYTENLIIEKSLKLSGSGAADTIIQSAGSGSVLKIGIINTGIVVEISGITIRNGSGTPYNDMPDYTMGGGIYNAANLTLRDSIVSNNTVTYGGGGIFNSDCGIMTIDRCTIAANSVGTSQLAIGGAFGGGVYNYGVLTITNSTMNNNAARSGDGTARGGAICNYTADYWGFPGSLTMTNCTISTNNCDNFGGGIAQIGGTMTLTNLTITLNSAHTGGGLYIDGGTNIARNSIVHGNTAGISADIHAINISPPNSWTWHNGITTGSANPNLGPLADNGGLTKTHSLISPSSAIDTGDNTYAPLTDQRGAARNRNSDIGAYEAP